MLIVAPKPVFFDKAGSNCQMSIPFVAIAI
jgi:hypothetical protein